MRCGFPGVSRCQRKFLIYQFNLMIAGFHASRRLKSGWCQQPDLTGSSVYIESVTVEGAGTFGYALAGVKKAFE
jgi:hypothetical protein